jgi:HTH-type transcriptional regulator / antitoxin HipB
LVTLNSIDLNLAERLKNPGFRREWFRAELESLVPEQFRDLRELRGWTQAQLAEKAEMKQSAVSRFESSTDAAWKIETLLRLADALDAKLSFTLETAEQAVAHYATNRPGKSTYLRSVVEASPPRPTGESTVRGVAGWGIKSTTIAGAESSNTRQRLTETRRSTISEFGR